jgi:hypothetical protein
LDVAEKDIHVVAVSEKFLEALFSKDIYLKETIWVITSKYSLKRTLQLNWTPCSFQLAIAKIYLKRI